MKQCHTATKRGKLVKVVLKDGDRFFDLFLDRTDKYVFFKSGRVLLKATIKSFSIVKGLNKNRVLNGD